MPERKAIFQTTNNTLRTLVAYPNATNVLWGELPSLYVYGNEEANKLASDLKLPGHFYTLSSIQLKFSLPKSYVNTLNYLDPIVLVLSGLAVCLMTNLLGPTDLLLKFILAINWTGARISINFPLDVCNNKVNNFASAIQFKNKFNIAGTDTVYKNIKRISLWNCRLISTGFRIQSTDRGISFSDTPLSVISSRVLFVD